MPSTVTLDKRKMSECTPYTSSTLLSWEAADSEVILLVITPNYLEKLTPKEFGNTIELTKVVDQFCQ